MTNTIVVIGGGLVGCLTALAFAKKDFEVKLYEARPDPRSAKQVSISNARSINLAISSRGILALESVDQNVASNVLNEVIPMHGRMVHDTKGNQISQAYGLNGEAINSINRSLLNRMLLDEVDKLDNVEVHFNRKFVSADLDSDKPIVKVINTKSTASSTDVSGSSDSSQLPVTEEIPCDVIIGADGSFSRVRQLLQRKSTMNYSQEYIDHLYLELSIGKVPSQPSDSPKRFSLDPNHLHIWPRSEYMLIALANTDGSFTSTMFAPRSLFASLEKASDEEIVALFTDKFPDATELITAKEVVRCFREHPKGSLVMVKCSPYNYQGKLLIIGDAAHSTVPFYGQGMNCGFEDVRVLMDILDDVDYDFEKAFDLYSSSRHKDLVSIIDLSMQNYIEMRHKVVTTSYLIRKMVDGWLCRLLGDKWLPLYTMVSFRPDISYSEAVSLESKHTSILEFAEKTTVWATVALVGVYALRKWTN